jgi:hypothetical protein
MSHPESQVHRNPLVEELVEELRDRVAFLERALERWSVEAERYQQFVAGFTQTNNQLARRLRELEVPQEPPGSPESAAVEPEREPWSSTGGLQEGYGRPQDTAELSGAREVANSSVVEEGVPRMSVADGQTE